MKLKGRLQQIIDEHSLTRKRFLFEPLPDAEYFRILLATCEHALRFFYGGDKLTTVKNFRISPFELLARTWAVLSSTEEYPKLYSAELSPRIHLIQKINDDTLLYYATLQLTLAPVTTKCLYLVSRYPIERGYAIVLRSFDPSRVQFRDREDLSDRDDPNTVIRTTQWVEMFSWAIFQDDGANGSLFHFGGSSNHVWVLEILMIMLRWEKLAVAPRRFLANSAHMDDE